MISRPRKEDPRITAARKKFGRPFAHEEGTDWKPSTELFLTRWMRERGERPRASK